jgi:hypothetical protein
MEADEPSQLAQVPGDAGADDVGPAVGSLGSLHQRRVSPVKLRARRRNGLTRAVVVDMSYRTGPGQQLEHVRRGRGSGGRLARLPAAPGDFHGLLDVLRESYGLALDP